MILQFQNVSFDYHNQNVLGNINFDLGYGELAYLVGASGAGKTTLLKLIYMELFPSAGRVNIAGLSSANINKKEIPLLRRKLGIIFQDFRLLSDRTVYDNLAFVLHSIGTRNKDIKKRIMYSLSEIGLAHKRNSMPHQLSGGEQQRVALARAMINNPVLILADEPTGNLDPETSEQINLLIKKINTAGTSILIATHKYDSVNSDAKILRLKEGKLSQITARDLLLNR